MIANAVAFCCGNICTFISEALHLQYVFHGIDLRLTGLVVARQSIFFVHIQVYFRINVRIREAQAEQYREPGRLEINHKVVMNDFSPVSSHIRIFVAAVCYACRRVSTFGKRGVRDMRRLRASCGFAYQYAL